MQPEHSDLLKLALAEAQVTVRAYDTKAQIVGVGYAFALGIISRTEEWFDSTGGSELAAVLVFWLVVIAPLVMFGFVLYPSRISVAKIKGIPDGLIKRVLYIDTDKDISLSDLRVAVENSQPADELMYELLKVSMLRTLKRKRFVRALLMAAFSFALLFAVQLLAVV